MNTYTENIASSYLDYRWSPVIYGSYYKPDISDYLFNKFWRELGTDVIWGFPRGYLSITITQAGNSQKHPYSRETIGGKDFLLVNFGKNEVVYLEYIFAGFDICILKSNLSSSYLYLVNQDNSELTQVNDLVQLEAYLQTKKNEEDARRKQEEEKIALAKAKRKQQKEKRNQMKAAINKLPWWKRFFRSLKL